MAKRTPKKNWQSIIYLFGLASLIFALINIIYLRSSWSYTFFTLGSWLALDWLDKQISGSSLLTYFLQNRHHDAFYIFTAMTLLCFTLVDYTLGVKLSGLWTWTNIDNPIYLVIMFTVMNFTFLFSMFELYRVARSTLALAVKPKRLSPPGTDRKKLSLALLVLGAGMVIIAFLYLGFGDQAAPVLVMSLTFAGVVLITDMLSSTLGGKSVLFRLLAFDFNELGAIILSTVVAAMITENINLLAYEWRYTEIPFSNIVFGNIPLALYAGWLALVILSVAIINLIQRADRIKDSDKLSLSGEIVKCLH